MRENLSHSGEMSSSVAKIASSNDNHEDRNHKERLDLKPLPSDSDPMALSLSLPKETFLRAAFSLKDQVRTSAYLFSRGISARIYRPYLYWILIWPPFGVWKRFSSSASSCQDFRFPFLFGIGKNGK